MSEGEKLREELHPGKSEEAVKAGFNNFFSTQAKNTKNPKIQGWDVSGINAQGDDASVNRWLPIGVHPKDVQLWDTTSVPLARGNCDQTTARDQQYNDTIEVRRSSQDAAGSQPEGIRYRAALQNKIVGTCNQDNTTSPIEGSAIPGDLSASTNEPAVPTAYDAWSQGVQGNFWGLKVQRKKDSIGELRVAKRRLEALSSRSTQLKESQDEDMTQLKDLEDKAKALRETISQGTEEINRIDREVSSTLEVANGLKRQICDLDDEFARYYAEDD